VRPGALWNFCPSSPCTVRKHQGQRWPAKRLNGKRYATASSSQSASIHSLVTRARIVKLLPTNMTSVDSSGNRLKIGVEIPILTQAASDLAKRRRKQIESRPNT
jgi:hypothetical protein